MQENEFEKQVKATIDGFRLRPSEPVWPKIREEIRDRRRRRVLLLIPVLAALIGLGYFAIHSFYGTPEKPAAQNDPLLKNTRDDKPVSPEATKQMTDIHKQHNVNAGKTQDVPANGTANGSSDAGSADRNGSLQQGAAPEKKTLTEKLPENHAIRRTDRMGFVSKKQPGTGAAGKKEKLFLPASTVVSQNNLDKFNPSSPDTNSPEEWAVNSLSPDNTAVPTIPGSSFQNAGNLLAPGNLAKLEIPRAKNQADLKKSGKIKWGVSFSAGVSTRADRPFNIVSTEKSSLANVDLLGNQVGSGSSGYVAGGGLLLLPASGIKAGKAFRIGITLDKSISKRLDVSAGLQYEYASDHVTIGKTIYTIPNRGLPYNAYTSGLLSQTYYAGMQPQNYTNKYQLIGLPVVFHFNLTRKWSRPLLWNAGVELSRVISSDVLLYDQTWGGLYYQGNKEISKTQFGVSTGFSVRLTGHNQWQWRVGPQVAVNTTPLFSNPSDKNKHIVYGSLNLQLLLPGKKR